ncbi:MAG: hypothetical protein QOG91_348 [Candidatus Parcubacteria bacterium]|jgi:hypothetical protein|nr:hypothetical protein [Candidatus Parcubacteria bacterium]
MRLTEADYRMINKAAVVLGLCAIVAFGWTVFDLRPYSRVTYSNELKALAMSASSAADEVSHLPTPKPLRAVYLTSWAAGIQKFRKHIFDLANSTEINSVVIDIKDYTGRISFPVDDRALAAVGSAERRIPDIKEFIRTLHEKGIYVIGRISVFQDSYLVGNHPEWAVRTVDGGVWKDFKGIEWIDPGATPVWDYVVSIGKEAYAKGFDELNFDYIRYPSDGNMDTISYEWSSGRSRAEVMKSFFFYLRERLAAIHAPLSIDLFGMTTSAPDDMGIGQNIADALPFFDFVSPMVYPSHFGRGFIGFAKPAEHPYEVVKYSMDHALVRARAASSSPEKLRPWLQAFDLGAIYTPAMVRKQMKALYDSGIESWMLWNAASTYDKAALLRKGENVAAQAAVLEAASSSDQHASGR